jgi:hypothetical protein
MRSCFPALFAITLSALGGCGDSTGTSPAAACPDGLKAVQNSEFCSSVAPPINCDIQSPSQTNALCGVAIRSPAAELARSSGVEEFGGSGPPDLGCFAPAGYPAKAGTSKTATMTGYAKIFSSGCESHDVGITVYRVDESGELGDKIGTPVTTASDCSVDGRSVTVDQCDPRWECKFEYADVPTETPLVILTSGADWAPLYDYNVYIPNDEVDEATSAWTHDIRAVTQNDYGTIPQASAFASQITPRRGVLAGEVHDCGDVRLQNAIVDTNVDKGALTYFTDNEDKPLPDSSADATSTLGLYAAFDIDAGPLTVAAAGLVGGQIVTVGYFQARIFEDSITAVTFRGLRPFQVP